MSEPSKEAWDIVQTAGLKDCPHGLSIDDEVIPQDECDECKALALDAFAESRVDEIARIASRSITRDLDTFIELEIECDELRAQLAELQPPKQWEGSTHWAGCYKARGHHECALAQLAAAQEDSARLDDLSSRMVVLLNGQAKPCYVVYLPMHDCPDPSKATLREAIDAERKEPSDVE